MNGEDILAKEVIRCWKASSSRPIKGREHFRRIRQRSAVLGLPWQAVVRRAATATSSPHTRFKLVAAAHWWFQVSYDDDDARDRAFVGYAVDMAAPWLEMADNLVPEIQPKRRLLAARRYAEGGEREEWETVPSHSYGVVRLISRAYCQLAHEPGGSVVAISQAARKYRAGVRYRESIQRGWSLLVDRVTTEDEKE